jgi:tRNA threonylcarbamoyladenosine biosynthesis protein TsaE
VPDTIARNAGPKLKHVTDSEGETHAFGRKLAATLTVPGVVMLRGTLGAGKTTLARGIAEGLGADPAAVHSPSFTLVNIYRGRCPIYHVDLYRVEGERDLSSIGLDDFLGVDGVTIIEWSERLGHPVDSATIVVITDCGAETREFAVYSPDRSGVRSRLRRTR